MLNKCDCAHCFVLRVNPNVSTAYISKPFVPQHGQGQRTNKTCNKETGFVWPIPPAINYGTVAVRYRVQSDEAQFCHVYQAWRRKIPFGAVMIILSPNTRKPRKSLHSFSNNLMRKVEFASRSIVLKYSGIEFKDHDQNFVRWIFVLNLINIERTDSKLNETIEDRYILVKSWKIFASPLWRHTTEFSVSVMWCISTVEIFKVVVNLVHHAFPQM